MESNNSNNSIRVGLALILIGAAFLLWQIVPGLTGIFSGITGPAMIMFGVAVILTLIGIAVGSAGMAIPVCVVGGIGIIFFLQQTPSIGYASWSYMWTIIPGSVGVGILLQSILKGRPWKGMQEGIWMVIWSAILFVVFSSALGGFTLLGSYWPVLLIVLGVLMILRPLFQRK